MHFFSEDVEDCVYGADEVEEDDGAPGGAFFEPGIVCVCELEI